jgi:hypothetical protein
MKNGWSCFEQCKKYRKATLKLHNVALFLPAFDDVTSCQDTFIASKSLSVNKSQCPVKL